MSKSTAAPSSNWEALKKKLPADDKKDRKDKDRPRQGAHGGARPSKKLKHGRVSGVGSFAKELAGTDPGGPGPTASSKPNAEAGPSRGAAGAGAKHRTADCVFLPISETPLLHELREMVAGNAVLNEKRKEPGNYIAIDCEMVGLGHLGSESALARVSIVNYHGHVLLDTFVQPREKVTDWRTWVSGVRERDIMDAPAFEDVQAQVAALAEGRILIGHAIENDMKALLLSHPNPLVRDTQKCKQLRERAKTKRPGLKKLVELELGLQIQAGSHSSVTDARATMALYRLHKHEWEASLRKVTEAYREKAGLGPLPGKKAKRKRDDDDAPSDGADGADTQGKHGKKKHDFPGGGRKGISSGLSVVVRRNGRKVESDQPRRRGPAETPKASGGNWWEDGAG